MKFSENGKKLLKELEGLRLTSYKCTGGTWTIGYGHTGADVTGGLVITRARAEELFNSDLTRFEKCVNSVVKVDLNQNQYDALICFVFNIGCAAFEDSTMLKHINNKEFDKAAWWFPRWNISGGKPCEGQARRRAKEKELFLKKG